MRWGYYLCLGAILLLCFLLGAALAKAWFPAHPLKEGFQAASIDPTISQVYHYRPADGYTLTKDQAQAYCISNSGTLATDAQLQEALFNGADWCSTGWLADSTDAKYPIKTSLQAGCGGGSPGIKVFNPPGGRAGANCYGPKPSESTTGILPFSQSSWSGLPTYSSNPRYQEMYMRLGAQKFVPNQVGTLIPSKVLEYGLAMSANNTINAVEYIRPNITVANYMTFEATAARYVDTVNETMFGKLVDATLSTYTTKNIIQKAYPRSWALFALGQPGINNDAVKAREYIYTNYDQMETKILQSADPTKYAADNADKANWSDPATFKTRSCNEIAKARTELRNQIATLRARAQDLSGTQITANNMKKENMKYQYDLLSACQPPTTSDACKKLASLDPYLFETIPAYEATLNQMFESEIDIQDKLDALNITFKFLGCSYTDLSGFDIDRDVGVTDVDSLKTALNELSPYYIAPVVLNYITKLLVGEAEIKAATQPILTNVGAVATNIGNIRSITMR